ncbi:hypothetical protein DVH05_025504 [Phytophthora capsici]|nr:hypothetical protein DVH05_025504 [Phytophthora capsici]
MTSEGAGGWSKAGGEVEAALSALARSASHDDDEAATTAEPTPELDVAECAVAPELVVAQNETGGGAAPVCAVPPEKDGADAFAAADEAGTVQL